MSVSIIIPAYNEELRLPITLAATVDYFAARAEPFELLVVDDGSSDGTAKLVAEYAQKRPEHKILCLNYGGNRGKGFAVRYGMLRATGETRLFCDADLATPVEEYECVLNGMNEKSAQVGIGSRPLRESHLMVHQPFYREAFGRCSNVVIQALAVKGVKDTQCGFKIFSAAAAQEIFSRSKIDGFAFDVEALYLARKLGYEIAEVPIRWSDKAGSKVNMVRDGIKAARDLVAIRWMHRGTPSEAVAPPDRPKP
jgi:dolichyl-phosphate beta-glucosyltransferase